MAWVSLSISTYEPLQERGEEIIWFVETAYEHIFKNLAITPTRTILHGKPLGGTRNRRFLFNDKNWARFRRELLNGELEWMTLFSEFPREDDPVPRLAEVSMTTLPDLPRLASTVQVSVEHSLYGGRPAAEWQHRWVDLACEAFVRFIGANGYLTIGFVSAGVLCLSSPYEVMEHFELHVYLRFRTRLRGYYWGNLLSREHIARLGGMEAITREAPCYLVRDLSEGKGERAYLQLTANLDQVSEQERRALREYLRDLLPVVEEPPQGQEYYEWLLHGGETEAPPEGGG